MGRSTTRYVDPNVFKKDPRSPFATLGELADHWAEMLGASSFRMVAGNVWWSSAQRSTKNKTLIRVSRLGRRRGRLVAVVRYIPEHYPVHEILRTVNQ